MESYLKCGGEHFCSWSSLSQGHIDFTIFNRKHFWELRGTNNLWKFDGINICWPWWNRIMNYRAYSSNKESNKESSYLIIWIDNFRISAFKRIHSKEFLTFPIIPGKVLPRLPCCTIIYRSLQHPDAWSRRICHGYNNICNLKQL